MTLEEAQQKIAELETKCSNDAAQIKQLNDNISKQNSYITKLEDKTNNTNAQQPVDKKDNLFNPAIQAYIEKTMKRDTTADAEKQIREDLANDKIFDAIKVDFNEFLKVNLKEANCTVEFIRDAFALVLGRSIMSKDHPIKSMLGKDTPPSVTPTINTNSPSVQTVQNTILKNTAIPPVMSNLDNNASTTLPNNNGNKIGTTKDAFQTFRDRLSNVGGNKFS